jgi:NAD(P)-dependent dehydrogenase (short-subunit alcohol dehydrogenase family)
MDSIRDCAAQVRALGMPLDVLMCNAGIMALPELEQVNGIEKQFAVNHLGHFLLVNLLLPQVQAATQGRVVVMSSSAYKWAPPSGIEFDNLSGTRDYTPNKAYGQSKTANGLFALQLARRFAGTAATANAVNPGPVDTNLPRHYPGWQRAILGVISGFILKPVEVGAATQCYVATAPALAAVSGHYFEDCNPRVPGGQMQNAQLAEKLWQVSAELCAKYLA